MHFVLGPKAQSVTLMSPGDYVVELEQPRRVVIVPKEAFEALKSFEIQEAEGVYKVPAKDPYDRIAREQARSDVRSGYADPRFRNRER
jgi:protein-L-isoaspartate O-methyltransferase